jgi:hypothetical protein
MRKEIKIAVYVAFIVAIIVAGYTIHRQYISKYSIDNNENYYTPGVDNSEKNNVTDQKPVVTPTPISSDLIAGYKLYKNVDFGFSIQYPATWTISEENIENVRGEQTKAFYFRKSGSDLRFAILPRDGLSYGLPEVGTSTPVSIDGLAGMQAQYHMSDGRRLWLVHPQNKLHGWSEDIGRIDMLSSLTDPMGDVATFQKMLGTIKFSR